LLTEDHPIKVSSYQSEVRWLCQNSANQTWSAGKATFYFDEFASEATIDSLDVPILVMFDYRRL